MDAVRGGTSGNTILKVPNMFSIRDLPLGPALGQNLGQTSGQDLDPNSNKMDVEMSAHDEAFMTEDQANAAVAQGGTPVPPVQEEDYDVLLKNLAKQTEEATAKQALLRREKREKDKATNADTLPPKKTGKQEFKSSK